jgi:hypothetical protein
MVPPANVVVVTLNAGALMVMFKAAAALLWGDSLSVTVTVKLTGPVNVPLGVPVIAPVLAFNESPAGRLPVVTAHV